MARLYLTPDELRRGGRIVLGEDAHRYLCRVLRLDVGSRVDLFDGEGNEASAAIAFVGSRTVDLEILGPPAPRTALVPGNGPAFVLIMALVKGEKMDLIAQKATELGVTRLWPVLTSRSVPRSVAMREVARPARWLRIAREAARQCGRADVPEVGPLRELDGAIAALPPGGLRLVFFEQAEGRVSLTDALGSAPEEVRAPGGTVALLVGPEGGFSDEEINQVRAAGFTACGMGPRILRAETAAIAALSIAGFALGDVH
jgi:16S rRNA (uracil1498-N3)-methyltransferase